MADERLMELVQRADEYKAVLVPASLLHALLGPSSGPATWQRAYVLWAEHSARRALMVTAPNTAPAEEGIAP